MAENVVKLRVDSEEYDAKIKRAAEGLQHYADECRKVGGTLSVVEDETLEFVRALGKMPTVAKSSTQGLRELTRATTDLEIQYRALTEEEKNSDFGKAMRAAIDELTERSGQMRDAMGDIQASIKNAASDTRTFDQIAGAASVATSSFQTFQGAAKLLGVNLGNDVEIIAKLQAAMALTNGLTQIQNALQKESAVMQGVVAVQTKAAAAAQALLAKNTALATTAGKAFNLVAKANPVGLLIGVIGAAGAAMGLLSSSTDDAADAQEGLSDATLKTKEALEGLKKSSDFGIEIARAAGVGSEALAKMTADAAKARLELAQMNVQSAKQELAHAADSGNVFDFSNLSKNMEAALAMEKEAEEAFIEANDNYKKVVETRQRIVAEADNQTTEKGIQNTINALREMRSEVDLNSKEYEDFTKKIASLEAKLPKNTTGRPTAPKISKAQSEEQKIAEQIGVLTVEYQELATVAKSAEGAMRNGVTERMNAIRDEIRLLQARNDELKKFAAEAKSVQFANGSLPALTQQLKELQDAQAQSLNSRQWKAYQEQIEQAQHAIDALKGKWQEGLQAIFSMPRTVTVTAETDEAQAKLAAIGAVRISDKTFAVLANDSDVLRNIQDIEGIVVDDKVFTVTAETDEAKEQLRAIGAVQIADKMFAVLANDDDVLKNVRDIEGIEIEDKSFLVTADTEDAKKELAAIGAVQIADKMFAVLANDDDVLKNIQDIEGIEIADKSFLVSADTDEAKEQLRAIGAVQLSDKMFAVLANDDDVLKNIQDIEGIEIADKSFLVSAETDEAKEQLRAIGGMEITDKTFAVRVNDGDVMSQLQAIEGVEIAEKTVTVVADTAEAYADIQELTRNVDGTTVTFQVVPKLEPEPNIKNSAGLSAYISSIKNDLANADFGSALYASLESQLADMTMLQSLVSESLKAGLGTAMFDVADELGQDFWTRAMNGGVENVDWQAIADVINSKRKEMGLDQLTLDFDSGKVSSNGKRTRMDENLSKVASGLSSVTGGLKQIGLDVPKEVDEVIGAIQGLCAIIQGVQTIVSVTTTGALTANTAALIALTAAVNANSIVSSIPVFAGGGIVPHAATGRMIEGRHYSGDNIYAGGAMVNAGELVLNKAAQGNLASLLQDGERGGGVQLARVSGEQIYVAMSNYLQRSGKGELVTWK